MTNRRELTRAAPERAAMASDSVDPIGVLRHVLERRWLDGGELTRLDEVPGAPRSAVMFEAVSLMEADEQRLRELTVSLLAGAHAAGLEVFVWVRSDPLGLTLRYGVVKPDGAVDPAWLTGTLRSLLEGSMPGIRLEPVTPAALAQERDRVRAHKACGLIVGVPSEREDTPVESRLDEALNGLAGRSFDVLIHCVPENDLDVGEANLAFVVQAAHAWARRQVSEGDVESFNTSVADGVSRTSTTGTTTNWSTATTESTSTQVRGHGAQGIGAGIGMVIGGAAGAALALVPAAAAAAPALIKGGAMLGAMVGGGVGALVRPPVNESKGTQRGEGGGTSQSDSDGSSRVVTDAYGTQRSVQVSVELVNHQAGMLEEIAGLHLVRRRQMRSFGAWRTSIYIAAEHAATLQLTGMSLRGALRGDSTHLEPLRLVPVQTDIVPRAIDRAFSFHSLPAVMGPDPLIPGAEKPDTLLSSEELALWWRPPSSPVVGVHIRPAVSFAAALPRPSGSERPLRIGKLRVQGRDLLNDVTLSPSELLRHVFVAGTTGSGKTSTVRQILRQLDRAEVPFIVVEPAKTEYRALQQELAARGRHPLRLNLRGVPTEGDVETRRLSLNPFAAPVGTPLGRHAESIKVLLRSCFAMQESLPQLLEAVLYQGYSDAGLNLADDVTEADRDRFPTFASLLEKRAGGAASIVDDVVSSFHYHKEGEAGLKAALRVRLQSFVHGLKKELFSVEALPLDLFERPVFIELADLAEPDVKRFLLGALVMRIAAERERSYARRGGQAADGLAHLLVLEEAHHFLTEPRGIGPGTELAREGNLLLAHAFAEMRAYGQGILLADQAPAELSPAVLRNTNTKIAHRLLYAQDCAAIGDAMGLSTEQRDQLRHLEVGEAVISSPSILRPVTCRINAHSSETK